MRRGRNHQRGALLIEALVAIAVLGIGTAGLAGMIAAVSQANRRQAFQNKSLEVFAGVASQFKSATCDVFPPNFNTASGVVDNAFWTLDTWVTAPIGGSSITMVGDSFGATGWSPDMSPPMRVEYYMSAAPDPVPGYLGPPAFDIEVRVREFTSDPLKDAPTSGTPDAPTPNGFWIRSFPVKKVCTARQADTGSLGGGRGEVP